MRTLFTLFVLCACMTVSGQVIISENPVSVPNASSMLEMDGHMVSSTAKKGLLIPRMTAASRKAIASPAEGLWVYQTDENPGYFIFSGVQWLRIAKDRTLPGKVVFTPPSTVTLGAGFTGYTVATTLVTGEFNVTMSTPFNEAPSVMVTAQALPPLTVIDDPTVYCFPSHSANCTTFFNADYLNTVRVQSCPGGVCVPFTANGPVSFDNSSTGCNNMPSNYVDYFSTPNTKQATLDAGPGSFFNLSMASGPEWLDNLFAWIDWNQDGDFSDSQETVFEHYFTGSGTNNPAWAALITDPGLTVPPFAPNGVTMMRAMSRFAVAIPNPCGAQTFGETEDYKILITGATAPPVSDPRAAHCNVSNITTSSFKVNCYQGSSGAGQDTSFDFYATEY